MLTIAVKTDPTTGTKSFDLTNSTASFQNDFPTATGGPFTTVPVPITAVTGDPNTGVVTSFKFSGTQWDPNPRAGAVNNGISGEINVNKTGDIKSSYTMAGPNPTITSYSFSTNDKKPAPPKTNPSTGQPYAVDTRMNDGINYNAVTGTLSIEGDTIVHTPVPSDPIIGAAVTLSNLQFTGLTTDGTLAIFWPEQANDALFTITQGGQTLEQANLPLLYYDTTDNLFYAPLRDTTLSGLSLGSPFLDSLASLLDPSSADFDPLANVYLTITPDVNFLALTDSFTTSGMSGASDVHFAADPVPEPSTLSMLAAGVISLFLLCGVFRKRTGSLRFSEVQ